MKSIFLNYLNEFYFTWLWFWNKIPHITLEYPDAPVCFMDIKGGEITSPHFSSAFLFYFIPGWKKRIDHKQSNALEGRKDTVAVRISIGHTGTFSTPGKTLHVWGASQDFLSLSWLQKKIQKLWLYTKKQLDLFGSPLSIEFWKKYFHLLFSFQWLLLRIWGQWNVVYLC